MAEGRCIELDVRAIPMRDRHARIFALFDSLERESELTVTSDHEPRPLRAQFEELRRGQYVWRQRMAANDLWHVTLRRIPTAANPDELEAFLRRCSLFADANERTRVRLAAAAVQTTLVRGQAVAEETAEWDGLGILRSGTLSAIITSTHGREHTLYEILPAEPFGEVSTLDGGLTLARYEVTSAHADVVTFPKPLVAQAMAADPALVRALASICAQRTRAIVDRFASQTSLPTTARVAAVLLPHAGPDPGLRPALGTLRGVTQAQIATTAGTVKEVVSRALGELEAAGAIARSAGHIARLDREKLTRFAADL